MVANELKTQMMLINGVAADHQDFVVSGGGETYNILHLPWESVHREWKIEGRHPITREIETEKSE